MDWTWAMRGLAGGAIIGASASLLLFLSGRVAGISGIVGGILGGVGEERTWRALFVVGLLLGGVLAMLIAPDAFAAAPPAIGVAIAAGALVGVGTKLGSGCTSGHGVCGLSRLSARSLVATVTFIATGALAVLAARALGAAS
jgi:uncharacterized membrane protein YedE/YeeE